MKTELILFTRPDNGNLSDAIPIGESIPDWTARGQAYSTLLNPNINNIALPFTNEQSGKGRSLDLYEDIDIPINYTIMDVREPEKRKTSWTKTVKIPGTQNNNRIFQHIYQISGDGWIKIGNTYVYQNFNPSIRKEIIVQHEGVQILKGNLQLKGIRKNSKGEIEYDIILSGDLTSLFSDVGESKLSDLDFSEWDHSWDSNSITKSWDGLVYNKNILISNMSYGLARNISYVEPQTDTLRTIITTTTPHVYSVGSFINLNFASNVVGIDPYKTAYVNMTGVWIVVQVISVYKFVINHQYPGSMRQVGTSIPTGHGTCVKESSLGKGYAYPLISWGDEFDSNSWLTTAMAPGYFVKEIWDKIFKTTNSSYESNFLNSEFFKRQIIIQKKTTYDLTTAEVEKRKFVAVAPNGYAMTSGFIFTQESWAQFGKTFSYGASPSPPLHFTASAPSNSITKTPFQLEIDGGNTTTSTGNWAYDTWKVAESGEYDINLSSTLTSWADINGVIGGAFDGVSQVITTIPGAGNRLSFGPWTFNSNQTNFTGPLGDGPKLRITGRIYLKRNGITTVVAEKQYTFSHYMGTEAYRSLIRTLQRNPLQAEFTPNFENNYTNGYVRFCPADWSNIPFNIEKKSQFLKKGDELWVSYSQFLQAQPADSPGYCAIFAQTQTDEDNIFQRQIFRAKWNWRINPNITLYNTPSNKRSEGSLILGTDFLPKDMTSKEFLKNIIKMFNLHIEPDKQIEGKYYIEPRDDYYFTGANGQSDYEDWTKKMNPDTVEMTPLGELLSKSYIFSNKDESDYWNKRYKDERGKPFQYYRKEIVNDFLTNETKIDVSFGSSIMINNPEGSNVVMPSIQQQDNGISKPASNSAARVLLWIGKRPYAGGKGLSLLPLNPQTPNNGICGWELLSSSTYVGATSSTQSGIFTSYPYAGVVDSPSDPYYDLNWYGLEVGDFVYYNYARFSNNNLYNRFWKAFIDEISDPSSMVVSAYFNLRPSDIYDLDFRKIYVVDGVYYRLQKIIDYSPIKNTSTKVELLKLKAPARFVPSSVVAGGQFSNVADTTRPVGYNLISEAPIVKWVRDGNSGNILPSSSVSNASISVKGQGNYIDDSKSVSISGNECYVGGGSENINIQGNGVFISGGVKNVSVIGTDKIIINESDVSYVNGIRYKNGVAISKTNVIDCGESSSSSLLDISTSKSTSITIVDGCEDVVVLRSSASWESIIESGNGMILPDLPELGITTLITPNPKTNYSGGYNSENNLTMAEIVRTNKIASGNQ